MTTYEVLEVGDPRDWESQKFGTRFYAYPVVFKDGDVELEAEWSRKQDSDPPKVGDTVVGTISNGPHGKKFKMDFDATKELKGGGTSSSGGSRSYSTKGSGKSPDQQASIVRQVALKILAPSINENGGLSDALRATVKELESFIGEASHIDDVKQAVREAFPTAQEQTKEQDDDIPF